MSSIMLATKVLHQHYRPQLPHQNVAQKWTELIQHCWAQNPDDRPTFDEILMKLESFEEYQPDSCSSEQEFFPFNCSTPTITLSSLCSQTVFRK